MSIRWTFSKPLNTYQLWFNVLLCILKSKFVFFSWKQYLPLNILSNILKISKVRLFTLILQHYLTLLMLPSNIYFYFHMRNRFRICLTYFHSGMKFFGRLKFMYLMEKTREKFSMYIKLKTLQCGMIWTSTYIIPNKLIFFGIWQ